MDIEKELEDLLSQVPDITMGEYFNDEICTFSELPEQLKSVKDFINLMCNAKKGHLVDKKKAVENLDDMLRDIPVSLHELNTSIAKLEEIFLYKDILYDLVERCREEKVLLSIEDNEKLLKESNK